MSADLLISSAIEQHKAGHLDEAEAIYRQILAAQPDHSEALHMQGLVAHQRGQHADAVRLIERAIALRSDLPDPWNNLGEALRATGELERAAAAFERALELRPAYAEAFNNLAVVRESQGKHEQALELLDQALALRPEYANALNNRGNVLKRLGRFPEARAAYEHGIAVEANPSIHNNLGLILFDMGDRDGAVAHLERAVALKKDYAEAHTNLGAVFLRQGKIEAAMARFELALAWQSDFVDAMVNLARALSLRNRPDEAAARLREALGHRPKSAELHHELGCLILANHHEEDAIELFNAALALNPHLATAHNDLGNAFKNMGLTREGIAEYREAVRLDPKGFGFRSNVAVACLMDDSASEEEVFAEHRRFGEAVESSLPRPPYSKHPNGRDPERRLRIGYLGPEFRRHILMQSLLPVLRAHDRERFEIQVFAHVPAPDHVTEQAKAAVDRFTFIHDLDDDAVAAAVHAAGIDLLIHPMGHWANNRLPVLARKPAPLQVSYLWNAPTTGLAAVDAIVVDPWLGPDDRQRRLMIEEPVYLRSGFAVYGELAEAPIDPEPPCRRVGAITFGSFNNPSKLTDRSLRLWARVIATVAGSRLLLKYHSLRSGRVKERLLGRLEACGVPRDRIIMLGPDREDAAHLGAFNHVDLVLDAVPFSGGRTTIDALWMGVPVVTRIDVQQWSRISYGFLNRIGLVELAVSDDDAFVALAAALARDPDRLRSLRSTLRDRMRASSLMDATAHVREFESALRSLWRRWCATPP